MTSEPMLPFDEVEETPADEAATVRLKADTTYVTSGIADVRSVRLQPPFDVAQGGPEALEGPDRHGPPQGGHYVPQKVPSNTEPA